MVTASNTSHCISGCGICISLTECRSTSGDYLKWDNSVLQSSSPGELDCFGQTDLIETLRNTETETVNRASTFAQGKGTGRLKVFGFFCLVGVFFFFFLQFIKTLSVILLGFRETDGRDIGE